MKNSNLKKDFARYGYSNAKQESNKNYKIITKFKNDISESIKFENYM